MALARSRRASACALPAIISRLPSSKGAVVRMVRFPYRCWLVIGGLNLKPRELIYIKPGYGWMPAKLSQFVTGCGRSRAWSSLARRRSQSQNGGNSLAGRPLSKGFPMPQTVAAGLRLAPDALTRPFEPSQFDFNTTDELEPFLGVLGQERAVEALQFGVAMPRPGYNVYVMGESGTGRFSFVKRYLRAEGKRLDTPSDWVYVNNFDEPR